MLQAQQSTIKEIDASGGNSAFVWEPFVMVPFIFMSKTLRVLNCITPIINHENGKLQSEAVT